MKKIWILSLTLLASGLGTYAKNCKSVKDKKDAFSDKMERTAKVSIGKFNPMGGGVKWLWEFLQADGATTFKLSVAMTGEFNQPFEQGTPLLLKLENGQLIKLETINSSNPVTQAITGSGTVAIFTTYMLSFKPSKEELIALSQSVITDLKVDIPDRTIKSPKVVNNQMEQIMDICGCLLATHQ